MFPSFQYAPYVPNVPTKLATLISLNTVLLYNAIKLTSVTTTRFLNILL